MATLRSSEMMSLDTSRDVMSLPFTIPEECDFPMPDARYVRAAEAYFKFASEECKPCLACRILSKAEEFGLKVDNSNIYYWATKFRP